MLQKTAVSRYSSIVSLTLLVGDKSYALAQIGPEIVILKQAAIMPPGPATIVMTLDGKERRTEVILQESSEPSDIVHTRPA